MKIALTGIKPTHMPHLGNYLGSIKPAIELIKKGAADKYLYFIADYHTMTSVKDPKKHQEYLLEVAASWLACGLDPKKAIIYKQSDVPEIFELNWILACHTPKGDLNRAHSYKAAVQANMEKNGEDPDHGVNAGLFTYPVLMAADILLFNTSIVPVGRDQVQHVEIARSIAARINQHYGKIFIEPMEFLSEEGSYVVGLDGRKMSKSYDNHIPLFINEKKMQKMINQIKTDSLPPEAPKSTDDSLIFSLFQLFASREEVADLAKWYQRGIGWGEAKAELFKVVNREISPMRQKYEYYKNNPNEVFDILSSGANQAREIARSNLRKIKASVLGVSFPDA